MRFVGRALLWIVAGAVSLVTSVALHIDSAPARALASELGTELGSEAIQGSMEFRCDDIDLGASGLWAQVSEVEIRDGRGEVVITAPRASARLALLDLLSGTLRLEAVRAVGAEVSLAENEEGQLRIAETFLPASSDESTEGGGLVVQVDGRITKARVVDVPWFPADLRGIDLDVQVTVDADGGVVIHAEQEGHASLRYADALDAVLADLSYQASLAPGGQMVASFRLDSGNSFANASASMPWVNDTVGPLAADVDFRVTPRAMRSLGLDGVLRAPVEGTIHAESGPSEPAGPDPFQTFGAELALSTAGGPIRLQSSLRLVDGLSLQTAVQAPHLVLEDVLAEELGVRGTVRLDAQIGLSEAEEGYAITLTAGDIAYDEWSLQALEAGGLLLEDAFVVERLDLPALSEGGHMNVHGRVGFNGSADLHVDADLPRISAEPIVTELVPTVRGRLRVDADVSYARDRVQASGSLALSSFHVRDVDAASVRASGRVSGSLAAPSLDVQLHVEDADVYGTQLELADVHVVGSEGYAVRGRVRGRTPGIDRPLEVVLDSRVRLDSAGEAFVPRLDGRVELRGLFPEQTLIEARALRVRGSSVSASSVRVDAGDTLQLEASGRFSAAGRSSGRVTVAVHSLQPVGELFGVAIEGDVEGSMDFDGSFARPSLRTEGTARGLEFDGLSVEELEWVGVVDQTDDGAQVALNVEGRADALGHMRLDVQGQAPSRGLSGDWRSATLRLEAETTGADLSRLHASLPDIPALEGTAGVDLRFNGSVDGPERLELFAAVSELHVPSMGLQVPRVELEAQLRDSTLTVHASASEPNSPYALWDSDFTFDRAAWEHDPRAILQSPWNIHIIVPDRELARMPLRELEGLPGRVQLRLSLEGGSQTRLGGPSGVLQAAYRLSAGEHQGCVVPRSAFEISASLDDARLEVEAALHARGQSLGYLRARSRTPIEQWIETPPDQLPLVDVDMDVDGVQLSDLPYLCDTLTGSVAVDGTLRHVFGPNPVADVVARVQGLRVQGSHSGIGTGTNDALDLEIRAGATREQMEASVRLAGESRDLFVAEAQVPMSFDEELRLPLPDLSYWTGRASFNDAPVAVLSAPVSLIGSGRGTLDGQVRAWSDGDDFHLRGEVQLGRVGFTLRQPLLRVEDLQGTVRLDDDGLHLRAVRFADRDGTININGNLGMDGWSPRHLEVDATLNDFPLRVEGIRYATIDTEARVVGDFSSSLQDDEDPEPNRFTVSLHSTAMQISDEVGRQVQSLEQHPDVVYEDQPGFDPDDPFAETASRRTSTSNIETRIRLESLPFYVRREDFSVQVVPELEVAIDARGVRIEGTVNIRRGYLSLVGKQFDFGRSTLRFAGGHQINPRLDVTAVHTLADNNTVTVKLTGMLLTPELSLTTSVAGVETEAEILALLVGGRSSSASGQIENEAAGFLAGLTAGVLSSLTRRQIGEYVPVFGIETDGARANRIRAAIQTDRLIPDFLENVVLGAHIEGYVGTRAEESGASATGGVELELLFPRSVIFNTRYEQGNNWGLEVRWEP